MYKNSKEYFSVLETVEITGVDYMTIYMQLKKFETVVVDNKPYILKEDVFDFKKMMDLKKKFQENERSKSK